ncbi:MAG: transcriptional repressor LexA [Candidatus Dadabacteria bacterium]|nr:MAG: transcriptional repressor LexA [Candidatus Dadabacteria bacterium]
MTLTKRQKEILDFVEQSIRANGYAPTLEEIAAHFDLSSLATVHKHISNLEAKGYIRRKWNHSRAIELVERSRRPRAVELPLLGKVAAGVPIEAIEGDDTVEVPESFVRRRNTYVLRVAGDSMIDEGILDGDLIVVEEKPEPANGEMVVASIDGEATVKRFYRQSDGSVRLQPANPNYDPIIVRDRDLQIRGVVVAVLRKYV